MILPRLPTRRGFFLPSGANIHDRSPHLIRKAVPLALGLLLLLALSRLAILGWHGALCRGPVISDPAWQKVRLPPGPCWEFWANRYQAGIGAAVAIAAATLAWRGTQRQLAAERAKTLRQDLYTTLRVRTINRRIAEYLGQRLDVSKVRELGETGSAFEVARRFADDGLLDIKTAQADRAVVSDLYQTLIMTSEFRGAVDAFRDAARGAHLQSKKLFVASSR